jgi:acyl carrier protein
LREHDKNEVNSRKIRKIQELERWGAKVLALTADVGDERGMRLALRTAEKHFGAINGVIYTAWQGASMPIQELKQSDCEQHFQGKVRGLRVLANVLKGRQLDFCWLTSSLASVLGGLGFGAYAAANQFMDAFAQKQNRTSAFPWIVVNWDGWNFQTDSGGQTAAITPADGAEVFLRSLSRPCGTGVVVSPQDLQGRIDKWINLERVVDEEPVKDIPLQLYKRPNLTSLYVAPRNDTEQRVARIWEELLGVEGPGMHDNFFELGGHSLLTTQLASRIRSVFKVELSLRSLFETATIAQLAEHIEATFLATLDKLSDEEAALLVKDQPRRQP